MTRFGIAPAAWAALAPRPEERGRALGVRLAALGVQLLDLTQVFGGYDAAALYAAADPDAAAAGLAALRALGPGRPDQTIELAAGEHPAAALRRLLTPAP